MTQRGEFDRLVLEHLAAMHRLAVRLTGDTHQAEEVVQNAMVKAMRSWRTFEGRSRFSTWMARIVINAFRDQAAHERRAAARPWSSVSHGDPAMEAQSRDLREHVARCVSRLPERQREALVLTVYEQMTTAQAAQVMDTSEQNIRTTLHYARRRLKEMLAGELNEDRR
jgi:RNA polymerase sigma-70 factor, ECF subfamily